MRRLPEDVRAFLAQYSEGQVSGQVPAMFGVAVTAAEAEFHRRLLATGHSGGYLAVLGLAATLTFDAGEDFANSSEARHDRGDRHGYYRGLLAALVCLVMHETGSDPGQAALQVAEHIETLIRFRWSSAETTNARVG